VAAARAAAREREREENGGDTCSMARLSWFPATPDSIESAAELVVIRDVRVMGVLRRRLCGPVRARQSDSR